MSTRNRSSLFARTATTALVVVLLSALLVSSVAADTAGPRYPTTGANVNGPGTVNWTNPGYVTADDTNYATAALGGGGVSEYLQATGFGFTIPTNARIDGIQVSIMRQSSSNGGNNSVDDADLYLLKAGAIVGTDHASTSDWPTSMTAANYGTTSDLWGTTWTPAEINAANFGVVLSVLNESGTFGRTASVDYITVTVTYTLPATLVADATNPSNKTVGGSQINQAVSAFTLATNMGTDTVTGLVVTGGGTGIANVATNGVKIYQSTNSEWDAGDTLVGTASFSGTTATFTGLSIPVTTTVTRYIITYDIIASPTPGQTMTGVVTGATATNSVTNTDTVDATLTVGYTITVSAGPGGTIQYPSGTVVTSVVAAPGANVDILSVPNTGYVLADVLVDGITVGRANTYRFQNVNANHTLAATFDGGLAGSPQRWYEPANVGAGSSWTWDGTPGDTTANGYTSNNVWARSYSFPGGNANYINFNIPAIPPGSIINGIEVAYEGWTGNTNANIAISGDLGSSFAPTSYLTTFIADVPDRTVILGGSNNTWGTSTWTPGDFANTDFYVRISSDNYAQVYLDQVQVRVHYTRPTILTTTAAAGTYGGTVDLSATLTSSGVGVSGETIEFRLNGYLVGTGVTDSNGVATLNGASLWNGTDWISVGNYPAGVQAVFDDNVDDVVDYADATATAALTVNQRLLTVTAIASNKTYDGNTTAFVTFADDRMAGDTLTIAYTSANFDDKNVGVGKTVTVTGINVTGAKAGNYTWNTTATATADITARTLTVTAIALDKVYDGTADATVSSLPDNRVAGDDLTITYTSALFSDKNVGTNKLVTVSGIAISGADAGNYNLLNTTATDTANISRRQLIVTAAGQDKVYDGTTSASVTLAHNGLAGDDLVVNYGSALFNSPNVGTNKPVSVSAITVTGADAANYQANETTATTANITKRPLIVTAAASDKVYDGTTTASASLSDDHIPGDSLTVSLVSANFDTPDVGVGKTVTVVFSVGGTSMGNYDWSSPVTTTANITPRAIEVTADPQTKVYGEADPALTYQVTNGSLAPGDTFSGALTRDAGETVAGSPYAITVGSLDPGTNYTFTFIGSTLTITKRSASVTPYALSKTYGEPDPTLVGVLLGFVPADDITANYSRAAGETVGDYLISATLNDPYNRLNDNYDVTYNTGTFTITRAPLTITADDQTKPYGTLFTFTGTEFSTSGLLFSDTVTGLTLASAGAPATADVGTYAINGSAAVGAGLGNYDITYAPGTLTVTKATVDLVVTPDGQTKIYGSTFSAFTGAITGILNGDNITATYSSPGAVATATVAGSPYTISATFNDPDDKVKNYNVVYNTAELTVTPAALTITASNQSKPYGTDFTFTGTEFTTSGLLNADTVDSATLSSTGAPAVMDIGDYPILISNAVGTGLGNYTIAYTDGTLTVTKATVNLVVTPDSQTKVYGEAFSAFTGTITGLLNGDNITAIYSSPGADPTATVASSPYVISATFNDPDDKLKNYTPVYNTGLLTVTRAALTLTANDQAKNYGVLFVFAGTEFIPTGLLNADTVTSATISSPGASATATVAGSPYIITISNAVGTGLGNYNITYVPGSMTVGTATLTVTADNKTITYGSPDPAFTFAYSGFQNGENASVLTTQPACTVSGAHTNAGAYTIACSGGVDDNYSFAYVDGTLTINPQPLTVTPDNKTKAYGDTFTAFTGTVNGIQYSDNITATYTSTGAPAAATVGTYPITATLNDPDGKLPNYTVTLNTGTLTIVPRDLIVTPDNKSKVYGDTFTAFTGTVNGLQNSDPITVTYASTGAAATATVGTYSITATLNDPSNRLPNYNVILNTGQLTVTQRPLVVTPDNKAKVYGTTFTAFTGSITGLQNGDPITASYSSPGAIDTAPVGVYPINTTLNDPGGFLPNYAVTINPATLTVGNTVLTVTANPQTIVYGDPDPVFTFTYSGFVGGDTPAVIDTPPTCTVAVPHANAGTYPITCSGGVDDNYIFLYVSNTLTVTQRPLIVTPNNQTKVYGDTFTAFTGTITGVQAGDNIGVTYASTGAPAVAAVGAYPITATLNDPGNRLPNYTVTLNTGTLTVTARALVVTPDNKSKPYGDNFTAFTGILAGLQAGDGITATYASTGAGAAATVGDYPITATLNDPLSRLSNYTVTLNTGTLTVTRRDLVVTPGDRIKTYGDVVSGLTGTISGLQNSDPITASYASTGAAGIATVGTYPITATLIDPANRLGNYNVTLNTGTLTVNARDLVVIPADKIKVYGTVFTAFTGNIVGIQNNDNITATYASAGAPADAAVGFYPISATLNDPGGRLPNYNISYNTGTLTVNQANTITTVTSNINPAALGQNVTFTATVSAIYGTPTGDVTFYDGVTSLGTYTLAGGTASFSINTLTVGVHAITAVYAGDLNYLGSTSAPYSQGVGQSVTATVVISDANPSVYGQLVTFTATVTSPAGGVPTGAVTFKNGAATIGTGALDPSGVATFSASSLSIGSHDITAVYGGDADYFSSTSPVLAQVVNQAGTTTALTVDINPSVSGQTVTFTATVTAALPGVGTPTGTVTFLDGANILGTGTLTGSVATFQTSALAVGTHDITASYGGDANFTASISPLLPQVVNLATSLTNMTSTVNPSHYGQPVTFTAYVSPVAPGTGIPTGTVTFYEGANVLGTDTLASGSATFNTSALAVGSHNITAVYEGDASFNGSTSPVLVQVVNQAGTTAVVTSSANPVIFGNALTFTASINAVAPGAGTPTGTVTFYDGATMLGTGVLDASGEAIFSTNSLAIGMHPITAVYAGDTRFTGSTSPVYDQQVAQLVATVTLSDLNHVYDGLPKAATVTTEPPGLAVTVTYDGSAALPVNAGSYAVVATVDDPQYAGSAADTLVIAPAPAVVNLNNLIHTYDGSPKAATITTVPPSLPVTITYDGSPAAPINAGSYAVVATVTNPNYAGTGNGTLVINKATVPVVLGNLIQMYDGTPKSVTVTTTPPGLTVDVTYDGAPTLPIAAGSYAVTATVNEANYQGSASDTLVITGTGVTVATEIHNASEQVLTSAFAGTLAHARALVTGVGAVPTGSVSFTAYNNYTCSGNGNPAGTINLVDGVAHPSTAVALTHSGLSFRALYNGDANYQPTPGACVTLHPYPQVLLTAVGTNPRDGATVAGDISMLGVEFNKDVVSNGGSDAANFVGNYLLVEDGLDNIFHTLSCADGAALNDIAIPVNAVTYSNSGGNGPFTVTLMVNNGTPLPVGRYRLFVCGTTSVTDSLANKLNNGESDTTITFQVTPEPPSAPDTATIIPVTGFAPGQVTALSPQSVEMSYANLGDLWMEIPRLGVQTPIVGVPLKNGTWDVSWLGSQAGYLEGSAFPTWMGNSVITAHVYNANGKPGPFVNLGTLMWGDQIIVHAFGEQYVYEVRSVAQVYPDAVAKMMKHETLSWVTLVTCRGYDAATGNYQYRVLVRAVLVSVK